MPWVRIDENAIDHPKFLALSDGAWRLWVEGLAYCQKHLTDGRIPMSALRGFRYFSASKLKALLTPYEPAANALWLQADPSTVVVHDYLGWNDSREEVLASRRQASDRRQRYRDKRTSVDASSDADGTQRVTATVPSGVGCSDSVVLLRRGDPPPRTSDETSTRAGEFCEAYAELHEKYRGVPYIGNARKDYEEALGLVRTFGDDDLRNAAIVFLTTDDEWVRSRPATVALFRSRVTWCLERIKARGIA